MKLINVSFILIRSKVRFLLCLLMVLICGGISAQSSILDSLLRELPEAKQDTNKVLLIDKIIDESMHADPKKAFYYTQKQKELVEKLSYDYGRNLVYHNYSECYYWFGQYDKMLKSLKKNDVIIRKLKLNEQKGNQILMYARYYDKTNQKEKAIENFLQALDFYMKLGDKEKEATTLSSFAVFYTNLGQHEKAKEYYFRSFAIHNKLNNFNEVSTIYINLGKTYYYLNKLDSAQYYLELCLEIQKEIKDRRSIASCKANLGSIFIEKGNYDKALKLFNENYLDFSYLGDTVNMAVSKLQCADVSIEMKKFNVAVNYINEALPLLERKSDLWLQRAAYELLQSANEKSDHYEGALRANKKIFSIDSMMKEEETSVRIREIEKKYQTKNLQEELTLMKEKDKVKDLQLMKNESDLKARNYFVILLLFVLLVLLSGGYFIYRHTRLRQQKRAAELEHIALRTQMNPHFIFNSLNSIQRMYIEGDIQSANEFMGEFGELMRKILLNSNKNLISFQEEINTLNLYLSLEKIRCKSQFEYKIEIAEDIDLFNVMVPPLVIQPFVENAIWHGILPKKQKGEIIISIRCENDKLKVIVKDNGVGISEEYKKGHESKGILITEQRLRNKVLIESKKGVGTTVTFYINYQV